MKNSLSVVALAAGLSQVTATGFGFSNAPSFSCPANTDNKCIDDMKSGFNWADLNLGSFESYSGFTWSGFTCAEKFGKRDVLTGRTFQSKCVTGKATSDKGSSPKISCDKSKGVDKTSITEFQVTPEFDCDLEFHYSMPDGSTCKHRSACQAAGTTVKNTQCGGATDVTIVYPEQPSKPQGGCSFGIHSIGFDCSSATSYPSIPATSSYAISKPSASIFTTSSAAGVPSYSASKPVGSSSFVTSASRSSPAETPSYPAGVPSVTASASVPVVTGSSVGYPAVSSSSVSVATSNTGAVPTTSSVGKPGSSTVAIPSSPAVVSSYSVTSYLSTSTVYTTSVQTITSCAATVTNCPAHSTALTTVTVAVSTTVCPVTETLSATVPGSQPSGPATVPAGTYPAGSPSAGSPSSPAAGSPSSPAAGSPSSPATVPAGTYPAGSPSSPAGSSPGKSASSPAGSGVVSTPVATSATGAVGTTSSPAGPVETLPCPSVVPSCLNTFLYVVQCKDNTDASCYCPDSTFTNSIFQCLYAHGESDQVISDAISYFQGICAPFVPTNPGIATGAQTITSVLTATATAPTGAAVTTVEVTATTVVPCTNESGETIPSSSSTVTIKTTLTAPGVIFSTVTSGPGSSGVAVVPGTYAATIPAATATTAVSTPAGGKAGGAGGAAGGAAPYPTASGVTGAVTTFSSVGVVGTGSVYPTGSPVAVAGAGRVGAGVGVLGFVAMALAL
ncbi:hypothetical protein F5B20DRAFT_580569 [Whalleya microplaca]|nr:hypothetical protein F5B20DRAFT_580569 [Whalleya microplaca]